MEYNTRIYLENTFQDENYSLLDLANGKLLTEDGHIFPIHKFLLARCSKYFSNMFCGTRKHEEDVLIPGIRGEVLSNILSYIYTGKIHVTEENICEVIVASHSLSLEYLSSEMKTFLNKNLCIDNCLALLLSALKVNSTEILENTYRFIETHFETLVYSTEGKFYDLPLHILTRLLNDNNLRVQNENVVWHGVVKWVEADLPNRLCRVSDLLMHLRINDVDDNLAADIFTHHIVSKNAFCQMINSKNTTNHRNVLEFHQSIFWSDPTQNLPVFKPRKPLRSNFVISYCGYESLDDVDIYVTYDENIDLWRKILKTSDCPNFLSCIDNYLYIITPARGKKLRYNLVEKESVDFSDFAIPRWGFAVVQLDRFLYILGGHSNITGFDIFDVEVYDPQDNVWNVTVPMLPVIRPSAVTLNGYIYVVGKKPAGNCMIAQMYIPSMEVWNEIPKPSIFRDDYFSISVYNDKIYLIGGRDHTHRTEDDEEAGMRDVEVFSPSGNLWYSIESLPYAYRFSRAVVIDNHLIVSKKPIINEDPAQNPPVQWNNDRYCWETIEVSSPLFNIHNYLFLAVDTGNMNIFCKENKMPTTVFENSPFFEMPNGDICN